MLEQAHQLFMIQIAQELSLSLHSVKAVVDLLESGNTIPFIARYRKEVTGNLDEVQIKGIQERHDYLKELEERRQTILTSIESQGKLTETLKEQILACTVKTALEDLYLPYKPKRRTKAMIAREKGLEPLALLILSQPLIGDPEEEAKKFIHLEKGVIDTEQALSGACDIVAEMVAEETIVRSHVREVFLTEGIVVSKVRPEVKGPTKFEQYYDFKEKVKTIPSHRYLAIRRGEKEEILDFSIELDEASVITHLAKLMSLKAASPFSSHLLEAIEDSFRRLLYPSVETDVRLDLKLASDRSAVDVFADNLRHLLLASPLGGKSVIGIDPGIRTGCKCVAVDETGKYLNTVTIYPSQGGSGSIQQAEKDLLKFIQQFNPYAIAIGNGTAGRETESFVKQLIKKHDLTSILVVSVNESGASIYSASEVAREEFPDLDLTIRGAISIARRLQDPLAELVKIDPKSIGVGQYQHDVHQPLLQDQLVHVVESCVNHVGVDLNTASASLLSYVSGIGPSLAQKIIKYRESHGAFKNRKQLREVSGFGAKTFEQAAGFLRIRHGDYPLDGSAVHPERYDLVEQIAKDLQVSLKELVDHPEFVSKINLKKYISSTVGELTLKDILQELKKPGRDPRATFEPPCFREDVLSIQDLNPGLRLEGIVTNVTAFGAFVDIGVHQDGLIHLSELSDQYVSHPSDVVKAGDKIKVEVLTVDVERKRISLTARIGQNRASGQVTKSIKDSSKVKNQSKVQKGFSSNPFASL
jgi:uncharacterized protein